MDHKYMKVDISFVIPAYNCEKYLKECVESIINQNVDSYEILIINDGSTDNTLNVAKELMEKYSNVVKIHCQKNKGAAAARNVGLDAALGKYIVFIDSDDMLHGSTLNDCISKIVTENVDILLANISTYTNGKIKKNETCLEEVCIRSEVLKYISSLPKFPGSSCSKIFKKDFLRKNNIIFTENIVNEDIDFMLKCFRKAQIIYHADCSWYLYRQNVQGSVTNVVSPKICDDMFKVIDECLKTSNENEVVYLKKILCYEYSTLFFYYSRLKLNDKFLLKKNFKENKYLLLARNLKEKAIYIMYSILGLEFTAKLVSKLYVIKSRFENLERNK